MSNLLKNNAYHILGLETSATQKDIHRRAKEIVKFLQIDDVPKFELDLDLFKDYRNEDSVKESIQKLTSPKSQIKEYFFWFHVSDEVDEQALKILSKEDFVGAAQVWEDHSEGDSTKSLFYKKNLAILYCLILFKEDNNKYLNLSLKFWSEVINSTKFWNAFQKFYKLNDELNTDQEILSDFHMKCGSYLSDLYTDLSHLHKNDSYISEFTKTFNVRGEKTERSVLNPIFHEITDAVEKLELMKVSDDGELDVDEAQQIKNHMSVIQSACNKLIDLGLYDDSQSKTIRDRAATAIRSIVLDIHNNLDDLPKAEQLLKIAMQFVGTSGMKHKIQQDLDIFENNKKDLAKIAPILDLMKLKKYEDAIILIDQTKEDHKNDSEFIDAMDAKKKEAITFLALTKFSDGIILFDKKKFDEAIPYLRVSASVVYDNLELFEVNKDTIESWLEMIKDSIKNLTPERAAEIDELRNKMTKIIDDNFDEKFEKFAMKVLIDSYIYVGLAQFIKAKQSENTQSSVIGWVVWIIVVIILSALLG